MVLNGSCFTGHLDYFQKPPLGGKPNRKPGDHGISNVRSRWFILFHRVWGPAWIEIHWNSIWSRARSHRTPHTTFEGRWPHSMTLEVCWDGLRTLSLGLPQFHGHGSWLVCEVALSSVHINTVSPIELIRSSSWVGRKKSKPPKNTPTTSSDWYTRYSSPNILHSNRFLTPQCNPTSDSSVSKTYIYIYKNFTYLTSWPWWNACKLQANLIWSVHLCMIYLYIYVYMIICLRSKWSSDRSRPTFVWKECDYRQSVRKCLAVFFLFFLFTFFYWFKRHVAMSQLMATKIRLQQWRFRSCTGRAAGQLIRSCVVVVWMAFLYTFIYCHRLHVLGMIVFEDDYIATDYGYAGILGIDPLLRATSHMSQEPWPL